MTDRKRPSPARTSKIFAAGASASALFSMVAAMGWQAGVGSANSAELAVQVAESTPTITLVGPATPKPTSAVVVIPKAVSVAKLPVQQITQRTSNTTTRSSG